MGIKTLEEIKKGAKSPAEILKISIEEAVSEIKRGLEDGSIPSGEPFYDWRGRISGALWKPGDKPRFKEQILCMIAEARKLGTTPLSTKQIASSLGLHEVGCTQLLNELRAEGKITPRKREGGESS